MSGIEEISTDDYTKLKELKAFLKTFDLEYENDIDFTIAIYDKGHIIATASKSKQVLKCFAIDEDYRGRGLTNSLVKKIEDRMFEEGLYHFFIYTKSCNKERFTSIGYKEIITSNAISILENGNQTIKRFIRKQIELNEISETPKACMIMNANPFTLGHRYLVETAIKNHSEVIVFVVSEDASSIPFDVRYKLVQDGLRDLKQVKVIETGPYLISRASFPTYFLKDDIDLVKLHTKIDCDLFLTYYKEPFNITTRYVGEEPYCDVTNTYNMTMKEQLEPNGVEVKEIKRKRVGGSFISASHVRDYLRNEQYDKVRSLIPETTYQFFRTRRGQELIQNLKISNNRH